MTDQNQGGIQVRGGALSVNPGVLVAVAEDLGRWAHQVGLDALTVSAWLRDPVLSATAALAPITWVRLESALVRHLADTRGSGAFAVQMSTLALRCRWAAGRYNAAERSVLTMAAGLQIGQGYLIGRLMATPLGLLTVAGLGASAGAVVGASDLEALRAPGQGLLALLSAHDEQVEQLMAWSPGLLDGLLDGSGLRPAAGSIWPATTVAEAAGVLVNVGGAVGWFRDAAQVETSASSWQPATTPRGVSELLARIDTCENPTATTAPDAQPVCADEVAVQVLRITDDDGQRRWIVLIPGTQDWSPQAGPSPFDLSGNLLTLAGRPSAARASVIAALGAAQVGPHEEVTLVGHSQGGMVAASLAADPLVRRRYAVTKVLTAGAPIAQYRIPPDVEVLAIEQRGDLVPRLEGRANPQLRTWTTITLPVAGGTPEAQRRPTARGDDPAAAHDIGGYVQSMQVLERSNDRAVVEALRPFEAGLPGQGARIDVMIVHCRRAALESS